MNKLLRFSIPILIAMLATTAILLLAKSAKQAVASSTASEETLMVTTFEDEFIADGDCSLREAVTAANTNAPVDACGAGSTLSDTITFSGTGTITLTSQLSVTDGGLLLITGGDLVTLSGGDTTRLVWVESGGDLTLQDLSVVDGYINGGDGAGIHSLGTLTILHCTISSNRAADASGCGAGGIYQMGGRLTVLDSTFVGNSADCPSSWGGAIVNQYGTAVISNTLVSWNASLLGGGVLNFGTLTVSNSKFLGNYAYHEGGAIHNYRGSLRLIDSMLFTNDAEYSGALHNYKGTIDIEGSTFSDNSAFWGGVMMNQGVVTVTNSTLSANSADDFGGAVFNTYSGTLTMTNTTLDGNEAAQGGSLYAEKAMTITNSVLGSNPSGGDCWGEIIDGGHNLSYDNTCGFTPGNDSLPNTDPLLGPLQDNGGPSWTQALLPDSPALDAGDDTQCPEVDQRGVERPQDGDEDGEAVCDMGAYELEIIHITPAALTIMGPDEGMIGESYTFTATVAPPSTTLPLTYTWYAESQTPVTHTDGLTDTAVFLWENPAVYSITVKAANLWGTISETHYITITDLPVQGLSAENDGPTWLGEVTTLSATVTSGTNISYTWDFGDEQTGSGQVVTHTYAAAGVYTATVTASNTAGVVSETTTVIVISAPGYWQYLPIVMKDEQIE